MLPFFLSSSFSPPPGQGEIHADAQSGGPAEQLGVQGHPRGTLCQPAAATAWVSDQEAQALLHGHESVLPPALGQGHTPLPCALPGAWACALGCTLRGQVWNSPTELGTVIQHAVPACSLHCRRLRPSLGSRLTQPGTACCGAHLSRMHGRPGTFASSGIPEYALVTWYVLSSGVLESCKTAVRSLNPVQCAYAVLQAAGDQCHAAGKA